MLSRKVSVIIFSQNGSSARERLSTRSATGTTCFGKGIIRPGSFILWLWKWDSAVVGFQIFRPFPGDVNSRFISERRKSFPRFGSVIAELFRFQIAVNRRTCCQGLYFTVEQSSIIARAIVFLSLPLPCVGRLSCFGCHSWSTPWTFYPAPHPR